MIERFQGQEGRRRLIEALKNNRLVEHDDKLADELADLGELKPYSADDTIIMQGAADNDVYLILSGEADIAVNLRRVATRKAREAVGEMSVVDPTALRSATVTARTDLLAFKISESNIHALGDKYPKIWKVIAQVVAERLKERGRFLNTPNQRPVLFLGCSAESLEIAEEIAASLKHSIDATPWTSGVFGPSGIPIDDLLRAVDSADFAAFVFAPDDKVESRGEEKLAPRDNTVFELGLFMGRLARERTFIIAAHGSDVKIPSDLLGVTPITYIHRDGKDLAVSLGPVCTELKKVIKSLGVR